MKVKLLKKIRKRFSIYEKTHLKGYDAEHYLYDGNELIKSSYYKNDCIHKIRCIIHEEYAKHSKHYNYKGKKIWHGK